MNNLNFDEEMVNRSEKKNTIIINSLFTETKILNLQENIDTTNIYFFIYKNNLFSEYVTYNTSIVNYNSIIDKKLRFINTTENPIDDYSSSINNNNINLVLNKFNNLFIETNSNKSCMLNINLNDGYNKMFNLDFTNANTISDLSKNNKYKNEEIISYIAWNKLTPKNLFYLNETRKNKAKNLYDDYIISFGPTIFDELLCLNKLLYENSKTDNLAHIEPDFSNNYIIYLIQDDDDYFNVLNFCLKNCQYIELYKLLSRTFTSFPYITQRYNTNIPEIDETDNFLLYRNSILSNKQVISNLNNPINNQICKAIIINIPISENETDYNNYNHGLGIDKSLDILKELLTNNLNLSNNILHNENKVNSAKIYIRTKTQTGTNALLDNLNELITNNEEIINSLIQNNKIIISSNINLDYAVNNSQNPSFNENNLNGLLCINNYNFYKKNIHYKIKNFYESNNIKINQIEENLDNIINPKELNSGYLDCLLIDYLIYKNINNNNNNSVVKSISTIRTNLDSNIRFKDTGKDIFNEYKNLLIKNITPFIDTNVNIPLQTINKYSNRKELINSCLQDLFDDNIFNNLDFALNERITHFKLFKYNNSASNTEIIKNIDSTIASISPVKVKWEPHILINSNTNYTKVNKNEIEDKNLLNLFSIYSNNLLNETQTVTVGSNILNGINEININLNTIVKNYDSLKLLDFFTNTKMYIYFIDNVGSIYSSNYVEIITQDVDINNPRLININELNSNILTYYYVSSNITTNFRLAIYLSYDSINSNVCLVNVNIT